jgi:hypothetical protein
MTRVSWSTAAQYDLVNIVRAPAVIDELRDNAEVTLHYVQTVKEDEGINGKTMWHRGFTHEQQHQIGLGTLPERQGPQVWHFFLFYRQRRRPPGFEVLRVRSLAQVAVAARALGAVG